MQNLPNWLKWLIVLAAICVSFTMIAYVNHRASVADMPIPDMWVSESAPHT